MPDTGEEELVETLEEESTSARRKFWLVLVVLLAFGLPLMFLPEVSILHLPDRPWVFEILKKLEDAMVIVAILAFGVDNYVKRSLVSMGRDDLYPFTIHPHVVAKLGFIHRVMTSTAIEHAAVKQN